MSDLDQRPPTSYETDWTHQKQVCVDEEEITQASANIHAFLTKSNHRDDIATYDLMVESLQKLSLATQCKMENCEFLYKQGTNLFGIFIHFIEIGEKKAVALEDANSISTRTSRQENHLILACEIISNLAVYLKQASSALATTQQQQQILQNMISFIVSVLHGESACAEAAAISAQKLFKLPAYKGPLLEAISLRLMEASARNDDSVLAVQLKLLVYMSANNPFSERAPSSMLRTLSTLMLSWDDYSGENTCLTLCFDIVFHLSFPAVNKERMLLSTLELDKALLRALQSSYKPRILKTLKILKTLAYQNEVNIKAMADEGQLNLIPILVHILRDKNSLPDEITHCLGLLGNITFTCNTEVLLGMTMPSNQKYCLDILIDLLRRPSFHAKTAVHVPKAVMVIQNLAHSSACCISMVGDPSNLIENIIHVLRAHKGEALMRAMGVLWRLAQYGNGGVSMELLAKGAHKEALLLIKEAGSTVDTWDHSDKGQHVQRGLNFIMNLAAFEGAVQPLKDANVLDIVVPILTLRENGVESIKCMFIVAFLVGNVESGHHFGIASLLHKRPETLQLLCGVLENTLSDQETRTETNNDVGYKLGTFCLSLTLRACQVVSRSDHNKKVLIHCGLVNMLKTVLLKFINNEPAIPLCGGGGADCESVELAIDVLLQLSFIYKTDSELRAVSSPMSPESGILETVLMFSRSMECAVKLSEDCMRHIHALIHRLQLQALPPPPPPPPSQQQQPLIVASSSKSSLRGGANAPGSSVASHHLHDSPSLSLRAPSAGGASSVSSPLSSQSTPAVALPATAPPNRHIMISYCWRYNPHIVIALQKQLQSLGYEVWRDQTGSKIVPHMSGSSIDRMGEAVDASSMVVICVSRPYKDSSNCRAEAMYAFQMASSKRLHIAYVMMDEEYTTAPDSVARPDGWLGFMLGTEIWYGLWDDSMVQDVAEGLTKLHPASFALTNSQQTPSPHTSTPVSSSASTPSSMQSRSASTPLGQNRQLPGPLVLPYATTESAGTPKVPTHNASSGSSSSKGVNGKNNISKGGRPTVTTAAPKSLVFSESSSPQGGACAPKDTVSLVVTPPHTILRAGSNVSDLTNLPENNAACFTTHSVVDLASGSGSGAVISSTVSEEKVTQITPLSTRSESNIIGCSSSCSSSCSGSGNSSSSENINTAANDREVNFLRQQLTRCVELEANLCQQNAYLRARLAEFESVATAKARQDHKMSNVIQAWQLLSDDRNYDGVDSKQRSRAILEREGVHSHLLLMYCETSVLHRELASCLKPAPRACFLHLLSEVLL